MTRETRRAIVDVRALVKQATLQESNGALLDRTAAWAKVKMAAVIALAAAVLAVAGITGLADVPQVPSGNATKATVAAASPPAAPSIPLWEDADVSGDGLALPAGAIARLGDCRFRHPDRLTAAALSPNGKLFASAGHDSHLRLWDARTGRPLLALETPGRIPAAVAFSADSTLVACGSFQMFQVWNVRTGSALPAFKSNETSVYALAFAPDGKTLATAGGDDLTIRLWDLPSGKELHRMAGQKGWAGSVTFAPDGSLLASAGGGLQDDKDSVIRLWNPLTGKLVRTLVGHDHSVTALTFSADSKMLASSSRDGTLRLWTPGGKVMRIAREGGDAAALAFSADGTQLAVGKEATLRLWNVATGEWRRDLPWQPAADKDSVAAAAFYPDGRGVVAAHQSGRIRAWDPDGTQRFPKFGHQGVVRTMAVSPDGRWLASAEDSAVVRLWDVSTRSPVRQFRAASGSVFALAFSPDSRSLAAGGASGIAVCWDVASGKETHTYSANDRAIGALAFAPDGKALGAVLADGTSRIWKQKEDEPRMMMGLTGRPTAAMPSAPTTTIAYTPDSRIVAYATGKGQAILTFLEPTKVHPELATSVQLEVASKKDNKKEKAPAEHKPAVVALSPDGRTVAARTSGGLMLWEVSSAILPQGRSPEFDNYAKTAQPNNVRWEVPDGDRAVALAFSRDGQYLAVGRDDGAIALWDIAAATELHRFAAHPDRVHSLAFLPKNRALVSAGGDASLMVWDMASLRGPPPERRVPSEDELTALWTRLPAQRSAEAFEAQNQLVRFPGAAVKFLGERFTAPPVEAKRIQQWIDDLDSNSFEVRNRASQELEKLGDYADTALQNALAEGPSLEKTRRLEKLVQTRAARRERELIAYLRALEVLERIGSPEARKLIKTLAKGPPDFPRVEAAASAMRRLELR